MPSYIATELSLLIMTPAHRRTRHPRSALTEPTWTQYCTRAVATLTDPVGTRRQMEIPGRT